MMVGGKISFDDNTFPVSNLIDNYYKVPWYATRSDAYRIPIFFSWRVYRSFLFARIWAGG